jgi:hypothetical protein
MSRIIITTHTELRVGRRVGNEVFVDTDELSAADHKALNLWMDAYPDAVRPDPTPAQVEPAHGEPVNTRPDVVERPAPDVEFVDPIAEYQKDSILQQIEQQQADERLREYQIQQGLVDDQHNANLIRDWLDRNGGYAGAANIDSAIKALSHALHWQPLSAFTKRLAGIT